MEAILQWSRVLEELAKKSDLWRNSHWKYSDRGSSVRSRCTSKKRRSADRIASG